MKNENEYRKDGRRYIREIRKCECREKVDGNYKLYCGIHQRGKNDYDYCPEETCLRNYNKYWYLDPAAEQTVRAAIEEFESRQEMLEKEGHRLVIVEPDVVLYYRHKDANKYDYLLRITDTQGHIHRFAVKSSGAGGIAIDIGREACFCGHGEQPAVCTIRRSTAQTIEDNLLYRHAISVGDEVMLNQLRFLYHVAAKEDCEWLEKRLGTRVLPPLGAEYDKYYVVDAGTIDDILLKDSGYDIAHRPYFAMKGNTHDKWQLNPHTKYGVDAAKKNDEAISFQEFLALAL